MLAATLGALLALSLGAKAGPIGSSCCLAADEGTTSIADCVVPPEFATALPTAATAVGAAAAAVAAAAGAAAKALSSAAVGTTRTGASGIFDSSMGCAERCSQGNPLILFSNLKSCLCKGSSRRTVRALCQPPGVRNT